MSEGTIFERDGLKMLNYDGEEYVLFSSIADKFPQQVKFFATENNILALHIGSNTTPAIESVPYTSYQGRAWIKYDYYANNILPLLNE